MPESQSKNVVFLHWLLAGALVVIGVFALTTLFLVKSQTATVTTTSTVSNSSPAVDSVYISSSSGGGANSFGAGITLTAGATKSIYINGVVSDANGYLDIAAGTVSVKFYRTNVAGGSGCAADNNNCYANAACTQSGGAGTTVNYDCLIELQYWADATDEGAETYSATNWTAALTVADGAEASASNSANTTEVNTLLALNIPSPIAFGSLAAGYTTVIATNVHQTLTQQGNDVADVTVEMDDATFTCTVGTIARANLRWSLTDVDYGDATSITADPVAIGRNVALRTSEDTAMTAIVYWNLNTANSARDECTTDITETVAAV